MAVTFFSLVMTRPCSCLLWEHISQARIRPAVISWQAGRRTLHFLLDRGLLTIRNAKTSCGCGKQSACTPFLRLSIRNIKEVKLMANDNCQRSWLVSTLRVSSLRCCLTARISIEKLNRFCCHPEPNLFKDSTALEDAQFSARSLNGRSADVTCAALFPEGLAYLLW